MIANVVMAALISAANVSSSDNLVYNVTMDGNRLSNKEVYTLNEGKYLKRLLKMDFIYNAQGQVTDKRTYVWNESDQRYVLKETERFNTEK